MRILSLTAGAAQMYCGSCLRDNALARELIRQGHEVSLIPLYTPTKTDEPNQSNLDTVLFGGINVYLQQKSWFFRHAPRILDRLLDSRWALKAAARSSIAVDARDLGGLTVAMLRGEGGPLDREFHKLEAWFRHQPRPDIVNIPNTLLISMAPAIRHVYDGPIVCTLQGEDLFLDHLLEPYRQQALDLIAKHASAVDGFISISRFYAGHMARFLRIPEDRIHLAPLGIETREFEELPRPADDGVFRLGYLARIAPEKGLHFLAEAWREFRLRMPGPARLEVAGYLAPEHKEYLQQVEAKLSAWGLAGDFHYHGELDRAGKLRFLSSLDAFSVPAVYDEPKGLYVLEAMAAGLPVLAPDRAVYREHLARCRGGLLFEPESVESLAARMLELYERPDLCAELGRAGRTDVFAHANLPGMARRTIECYERCSARPAPAPARATAGA
jgi:glycosyltransferase involved in cell wall biosynthesis